MQLDVVIGFFILGVLLQLFRSPIDFPDNLYKGAVIFLLLAIGLKGGIAMAAFPARTLLIQSAAVIAMGAALPLIAFPFLYKIARFSRIDAASIAAHYGSVSVATYAVAVALLNSKAITYEAYFPLFVALLEAPAIIVGLLLAKGGKGSKITGELLHEVFLNQGVALLTGGLLIGFFFASQVDSVMPFFGGLFHGVLALFLLEMGRRASSRLGDIKRYGVSLLGFGIGMPLVGASIACGVALLLGLSPGGIFLLTVLGSSASYIAVPAAMSVALPQANQSLSMTASLAVTFPFNVIIALPIYLSIVMNHLN